MASTKNEKAVPLRAQPTAPVATVEASLDPVQGFYHKWIFPYSWRIALLTAVVLLAIAAARTLLSQRDERQGAAFAALRKAETTDTLLAVARDHDGTPAAARAQLEAARRLYDDGKYEQAATKFSLARKSAPDDAVAVAAGLGEAYALEASGKPELAEKCFSDLAEKTTSEALAMDAWLGAGRSAKAQGKLAEAEKYYGRAKLAAGDSPFSRRRVEEAMNALSAARYARPAAEAPAAPAADAAAKAPAPAPAIQVTVPAVQTVVPAKP